MQHTYCHSPTHKPFTINLGAEWHQALYELEQEGFTFCQLAHDLGDAMGIDGSVPPSMVERMARRWGMALMSELPW